MKAEWRPLPVWPYPPAPKQRSSFKVSWTKTLDDLEREITLADGVDVLIGVVFAPDALRLDGSPRAGFKVDHEGAEVSFSTPERGRVVFHTDAFGSLQENLRAISLGLTALRAIDRYGITTSGEQYAGFAQLGSGDPVERGAALVREAGSLEAALKRHHPDKGGSDAATRDILAYRAAARASH